MIDDTAVVIGAGVLRLDAAIGVRIDAVLGMALDCCMSARLKVKSCGH